MQPHSHSRAPTPPVVAETVCAVGELRESAGPFDVVITGRTPPEEPGAATELGRAS
jgi:hypothetical protein